MKYSKSLQNWLKEKGIKDTGKYFINFIEEFWMPDADIGGIKIREDIEDWHNGRIEVIVDDYEFDVDEIRFFTKDPSFNKFRDEWDFSDVNAKQLDKIEQIVRKLYQK